MAPVKEGGPPSPATPAAVPQRSLGLLSVVAPMHDERQTVEAFYARTRDALEGIPFELVIVDDASTDGTGEALDQLAASDPRVRVLHLSRNFGHQASLTAGLEHARGDAVAMLDGDLQDPPELIREMLEHWRAGSEVVYAVRSHRPGETRFKLATARGFYWLFARLSGLELHQNSGDFRLLGRAALDALLSMPERNRFLRGMTVWVGFTQTAVPYPRESRRSGQTKYSLKRMVRFSLDAISSFSFVPLQIATLIGFVAAAVAFLALPLTVLARFAGVYVPGVSSILFVVLLLGGLQLMAIGVIGEYLGRIYDEVKRRPLYLVRDRRNFADAEAPAGEPQRSVPTAGRAE